MTINEGLSWKKTLQTRHAELVRLRDANSGATRQRFGTEVIEHTPSYDAKKLDKRITLIAREIRLLDSAIKTANAVTQVPGYTQNDDVLGELED